MILKQGEAKTITFTVTDSAGTAQDLTGSTFTFVMSQMKDTTAVVTVANAAFGIGSIATGVITCPLSTANTDRAGKYRGELKIVLASGDVDKSKFIEIDIVEAITP